MAQSRPIINELNNIQARLNYLAIYTADNMPRTLARAGFYAQSTIQSYSKDFSKHANFTIGKIDAKTENDLVKGLKKFNMALKIVEDMIEHFISKSIDVPDVIMKTLADYAQDKYPDSESGFAGFFQSNIESTIKLTETNANLQFIHKNVLDNRQRAAEHQVREAARLEAEKNQEPAIEIKYKW